MSLNITFVTEPPATPLETYRSISPDCELYTLVENLPLKILTLEDWILNAGGGSGIVSGDLQESFAQIGLTHVELHISNVELDVGMLVINYSDLKLKARWDLYCDGLYVVDVIGKCVVTTEPMSELSEYLYVGAPVIIFEIEQSIPTIYPLYSMNHEARQPLSSLNSHLVMGQGRLVNQSGFLIYNPRGNNGFISKMFITADQVELIPNEIIATDITLELDRYRRGYPDPLDDTIVYHPGKADFTITRNGQHTYFQGTLELVFQSNLARLVFGPGQVSQIINTLFDLETNPFKTVYADVLVLDDRPTTIVVDLLHQTIYAIQCLITTKAFNNLSLLFHAEVKHNMITASLQETSTLGELLIGFTVPMDLCQQLIGDLWLKISSSGAIEGCISNSNIDINFWGGVSILVSSLRWDSTSQNVPEISLAAELTSQLDDESIFDSIELKGSFGKSMDWIISDWTNIATFEDLAVVFKDVLPDLEPVLSSLEPFEDCHFILNLNLMELKFKCQVCFDEANIQIEYIQRRINDSDCSICVSLQNTADDMPMCELLNLENFQVSECGRFAKFTLNLSKDI